MIERISYKGYCGQCYRNFMMYELTFCLPIDNDSYCQDCCVLLGTKTSCSWINNIFLGGSAREAKQNIFKLIDLYNDSLDMGEDELTISIKE